MKKRFLSLTLLFLFVLGMAMPVSAHEEIGKEIDLQAFAKVNQTDLCHLSTHEIYHALLSSLSPV